MADNLLVELSIEFAVKIVKMTDKRLLNKTGGIVQGMSGSPIVQNGKFVGAITHVFVESCNQGYGIFAKNMVSKTTPPAQTSRVHINILSIYSVEL